VFKILKLIYSVSSVIAEDFIYDTDHDRNLTLIKLCSTSSFLPPFCWC